jgi:hypothetical protein
MSRVLKLTVTGNKEAGTNFALPYIHFFVNARNLRQPIYNVIGRAAKFVTARLD